MCEEQRDGFRKHGDQRDDLSNIREDRRDGFSKIREDRDDARSKVDAKDMQTTGENGRNDECESKQSVRLDVLEVIESELEDEEVNSVDVVQEVVEITVDSGASKSVWPIRMKGVTRTKATKTVRLAAANGSLVYVEGHTRLEWQPVSRTSRTRALARGVR